jgi:hypothetical protein
MISRAGLKNGGLCHMIAGPSIERSLVVQKSLDVSGNY